MPINIKVPITETGLKINPHSSPKGELIVPANWGMDKADRAKFKKGIENILVKPQTYVENGVTKTATLQEVLSFASEMVDLPQSLILGFIMAESGGWFDSKITDTAGGLMHWKAKFVGGTDKNNVLTKEFTSGRLTDKELKFLNSHGIKFDEKGMLPNLSVEKHVKHPFVNAYIGSMILSQYIDSDWATENGVLRLDRIIPRYNRGSDVMKLGIAKKNVKDVYAIIPETSQRYVGKVAGKGGALDVIINDMKMTF